MPSSPNYKRDYKQEARTAKRRGEQGTGPNGDNAKRKRARRTMQAKGLVKPGQDVDHKRPLSKGGGNKAQNLRAVAKGANRSFKRSKDGSIK